MNSYDLLRNWFNFKFENPDLVNSKHSELFCYLIDKWNRLGQKDKFGLPTQMTMEVLGIGSYNTYKKIVSDLIDFGFIDLIQESKNQHQSKVIALSINDKALDKALDKATIKATDKATDTIDKQINKETKKKDVESDKENNKQQSNVIDFDKFIESYHKQLTNLPKILTLTDKRKKLIKARIKEHGIIQFKDVLRLANESKFLTGRITPFDGRKSFRADIDWLMNPNNFVKVLEGKYKDQKENANMVVTYSKSE